MLLQLRSMHQDTARCTILASKTVLPKLVPIFSARTKSPRAPLGRPHVTPFPIARPFLPPSPPLLFPPNYPQRLQFFAMLFQSKNTDLAHQTCAQRWLVKAMRPSPAPAPLSPPRLLPCGPIWLAPCTGLAAANTPFSCILLVPPLLTTRPLGVIRPALLHHSFQSFWQNASQHPDAPSGHVLSLPAEQLE